MQHLSQWSNLAGSMRVRILAAAVVLLAGSSLVSILLLRGVLLERLDEEIIINLQQESEEFVLLTGGTNPETGQPFGDDFAAIVDVYLAREVPDEGETLLAFIGDELYAIERDGDGLDENELAEAIGYWLSLDEREEGRMTTAGGETRYVALPFDAGDENGLFVVANFPKYEETEIDDAVVTQGLIMAATIALASVLGWFLAGRVLRPLQSLADTAQTITETDLTRRIPVRGHDEASRIAIAFNDMLERLEHAFTTQRRFLDEASHELRAPLTVIRGHMELLELEDDPAERAATTTLITNEIERMNRMVEDLLTLARAQRPGFLDLGQVDLAELTEDAYRHASVLCRREWILESVGHGTVRADGQRLTQALMQLAENACQHGGDGPVRIGSAIADGKAVLWVHDSGAGVTLMDRDHVFERFVKTPGRRESSGLGLSIVAAIARAHGGSARLAETEGRGARFEIVIPLTARYSGATRDESEARTASSSAVRANGFIR